ncbi:MAG: hypothetical protein MCSN_2220 [Candidatus Microsyncoccus archaeolyticus]|nr:MAG: hypothetical protein MCSN_2220 [Candidatus Parcubacteria bacterium]
MDVVEKTKEFIGFLDIDPKWFIFEEEGETDIAISLDFSGLYYGVNHDAFSCQGPDEVSYALKTSIKAVRLRAQRELKLEIFPFLDCEKTGVFKNAIQIGLEYEDLSFDEIDLEIVSGVSNFFWIKNRAFLPLIKHMITLNAEDIVRITEPFISKST